jgi:hypothetical protein
VLEADPLARLKAPKKNPARERWETEDVDRAIVAAASPQYRAAFAFIKATGCDVGSAWRAQLGDLGLAAPQATSNIRGTKTDSRKRARRHDRGVGGADPHRALKGIVGPHTPLFPGLTNSGASHHHERCCAAVGVEDYTLKDARHSVGVRMRLAGRRSRRSPSSSGRRSIRPSRSTPEGALSEAVVVDRFLTSVGQTKPQLVGFNSASADLPAIIQRALVHRIAAPKFCARPAKPWEGVDYFVKHGDWSVDLKDVLTGAGYGKSTPSLNEIAAACGIPAKGSIDGSSVLDLWQLGEIAEIVRYNQRDALTTYVLLLRVLHLAGKIDLAAEEARVAVMLEQLARTEGNAHLRAFLDEWKPTTARAA